MALETVFTVAAGPTRPDGTPTYLFGPSGTSFTAPVTVKLPAPAGGGPVAIYWSKVGTTTSFDVVPASVVGGLVQADVSHFSVGFVGAPCSIGAVCTSGLSVCQVGALSCSTGAPVCSATGFAADGTPCGTGLSCASGACVPTPSFDRFALGTVHSYAATQAGAAAPAQTVTVIAERPDAFTRRSTVAGSTTVADSDWLLIGDSAYLGGSRTLTNGSQTGFSTFTPPAILRPPMLAGATTTTVSTVTNGTATSSSTTRSATVGALESVTVPAGTFQARKVTTVFNGSTSAETWWAPGVGRVRIANYATATPGGTPASELLLSSVTSTCTGKADGTAACVPPGNACSPTSACQGGVCVAGPPTNCDDGNPCTADSCSPASGCAHAVVYDGTTCGAGQICSAGACVAGAVACNGLDVMPAPLIQGRSVAADAPTPVGGTLVDGTYYLTDQIEYMGAGASASPGGLLLREIMVLQGGVLQRFHVNSTEPAALHIIRTTATVTPAGTSLGVLFTCGAGSGFATAGYTATGAQLRLFELPSGPGVNTQATEYTYTRQ